MNATTEGDRAAVDRPEGARAHVMFVHAHPDDESSKGAATAAKLAADGHRVSVVTLTDGSRGRVLNPNAEVPLTRETMREIRARELEAALGRLGVTDHSALGYPDSGHVPGWDGLSPLEPETARALDPDCLYRADPDEVTARLVGLVRSERPDVLVTYPPDGDCPHPDHTRTHELTVRAFDEAPNPNAHPGTGAPWTPAKLYYVAVSNPDRTRALHQACLERGIPSPFSGRKSPANDPDPSTTFVDVIGYLERKAAARRAHATQVGPAGAWFRTAVDLIEQTYPYEAFALARTRVRTEFPEQRLLDGSHQVAAVARDRSRPVVSGVPGQQRHCEGDDRPSVGEVQHVQPVRGPAEHANLHDDPGHQRHPDDQVTRPRPPPPL